MINIHTITNTPPQMPNALVSRVKKQAANVIPYSNDQSGLCT